ncbi:MAG TPA: outer membrane protein assembly factor BamD [Candidatus Binatia bacterium]|jgi:outer membrane protein assembly factor BamD
MRLPRPLLRKFAVAGTVAAACAVLSACSAAPTPPEDDLFREASIALEDESYATAISDYKKLLEQYPFSDKAEIASLNIAYAHYLTGQYGDAIASFNDFERLYPVSPLLPFVSYTIGMCWLEQAKDGFRDPTASAEALRQFKKVASEFPRTLYADLAVFRQQQAREDLAAHELVVGDFYRRKKRYDAAQNRYSYVITQYPNTENAARAAARLKDVQLAGASQAEKAQQAKDQKTVDDITTKAAAEAKHEQIEGKPTVKIHAEPPVGAPTPDTPPGDPSASKPTPPSPPQP